jgi:hypothetical protein
MSEQQLRVVIRSAAARERNKSLASRSLHRKTRLAAVEFYRDTFGESDFLQQFSAPKLPPPKHMWLPRGYAFWRECSNSDLQPTAHSLALAGGG